MMYIIKSNNFGKTKIHFPKKTDRFGNDVVDLASFHRSSPGFLILMAFRITGLDLGRVVYSALIPIMHQRNQNVKDFQKDVRNISEYIKTFRKLLTLFQR